MRTWGKPAKKKSVNLRVEKKRSDPNKKNQKGEMTTGSIYIPF